MSHTPGPWGLDDDTMEIFSNTTGHSTGWIAKVLGNDDNGRPLKSDEMTANACLIAAAPELLAALKALVDAQVCRDGGKDCAICEDAYAAIAKAEGRDDA
jgi:hypothetical protein